MSGVSGVGGGSGAGKIPPKSNNDGKKPVGNFGGHEVSSSGSSQEAVSNSSSVNDRAQALLTNLQVHSPTEQAGLESNQQERSMQRPGLLSRIWSAVTRFFRGSSRSENMEISNPNIPDYQKYGKRLPGVSEYRMRLVRVSSQGLSSVEEVSDATEATSLEEVSETTETTPGSKSKEAAKSSKKSRLLAALGDRICGLCRKSWSKTVKPSGPLDPQHLITVEELRAMADSYTRLAGMSDDATEKAQMLKLANDCRRRANLLDSSGGEDPLEGPSSVDTRGASSIESSRDVFMEVSSLSDAELVTVVDDGSNAEHTLGSLEEDVQVVLEAADAVTLQTQEETSLSQVMRDRLISALRRLWSVIREVLTIISTVLVGLCRRMRRGLMALGEAVTRCCRHNQDQEAYQERPLSEGRALPEELRRRIQDILNLTEEEGGSPLNIPDRVVDQWRAGTPQTVVVDLHVADVGEGYSVIGSTQSNQDGLYEIMSSPPTTPDSVYEYMQSILSGSAEAYYQEPSSALAIEEREGERRENPYILDPESRPSLPFILTRPLPPRPTQPVEENIYEVPRSEPVYLNLLPTTSSLEDHGENIYEEVSLGIGVTPGFGNAARAAVLAEASSSKEKRVRFNNKVQVLEFDPTEPPSAIRTAALREANIGGENGDTLLSRLRKAFSNFLSKTS